MLHSGEVSVVSVTNISAGGMYIETTPGEQLSMELHERVVVYMHLDEQEVGEEIQFESPAEVVRINAGGTPGYGLMWTSHDPKVTQKIAQVLLFLMQREGIDASDPFAATQVVPVLTPEELEGSHDTTYSLKGDGVADPDS